MPQFTNNLATENNRQPRHKGILAQHFCLLGDLLREYPIYWNTEVVL
jgi:hypothetical protein